MNNKIEPAIYKVPDLDGFISMIKSWYTDEYVLYKLHEGEKKADWIIYSGTLEECKSKKYELLKRHRAGYVGRLFIEMNPYKIDKI